VDSEAVAAFGITFEAFESDPSLAERIIGVVGVIVFTGVGIGPGWIELLFTLFNKPEAYGRFSARLADGDGIAAYQGLAQINRYQETASINNGMKGALDYFDGLSSLQGSGISYLVDPHEKLMGHAEFFTDSNEPVTGEDFITAAELILFEYIF